MFHGNRDKVIVGVRYSVLWKIPEGRHETYSLPVAGSDPCVGAGRGSPLATVCRWSAIPPEPSAPLASLVSQMPQGVTQMSPSGCFSTKTNQNLLLSSACTMLTAIAVEIRLRLNNTQINLVLSSACTMLTAIAVEIRRRLGNAQINFDKLCCASAIKNKFLWHSA